MSRRRRRSTAVATRSRVVESEQTASLSRGRCATRIVSKTRTPFITRLGSSRLVSRLDLSRRWRRPHGRRGLSWVVVVVDRRRHSQSRSSSPPLARVSLLQPTSSGDSNGYEMQRQAVASAPSQTYASIQPSMSVTISPTASIASSSRPTHSRHSTSTPNAAAMAAASSAPPRSDSAHDGGAQSDIGKSSLLASWSSLCTSRLSFRF